MSNSRTGAWVGVVVFGFLGVCSIAEAKTVCVATTGNDANDGLSWATAKLTVQAGLNAAQSGDQVWVAAGTYVECITLVGDVALYGGFAGTETDLAQRDWKLNRTILDGDAAGSVVTSPFRGGATTRIDGFTIRNGKADSGGGIYGSTIPYLIVTNNTITGNTAATVGGGLFGAFSAISNNTISNNEAMNGGGIWCLYSIICNNTIKGNKARSTGGGVYCNRQCTITDSTITENSAINEGGAIYFSTPWFIKVANTIIAFNSSGIGSAGYKPNLISNCVYANAAYNYSGMPDPTGTMGNISADPQFVHSPSPGADGQWGTADDDSGDLHLMSGSPCIDAGDNASVPADILTDLDGLARLFDDPATADTGPGVPPIVDMGAYEYHTPTPGDFDLDGDVDTDDLNAFLRCLSGQTNPYSDGCAMADLDKDGDVDQSDFGILQRCFSGAGNPAACGN